MSIDFTLPPEVEDVRLRVRKFMEEEVRPVQDGLQREEAERGRFIQEIVKLRQRAKDQGLWNPHMPKEWDGMGLSVTAMAFVSAEAARIGGTEDVFQAVQAMADGLFNEHVATRLDGAFKVV